MRRSGSSIGTIGICGRILNLNLGRKKTMTKKDWEALPLGAKVVCKAPENRSPKVGVLISKGRDHGEVRTPSGVVMKRIYRTLVRVEDAND